jgi:hypothetical protein
MTSLMAEPRLTCQLPCITRQRMADEDSIQPSSIRIPADLKEAVIKRGKANTRTFSQQVVWVLRQHVESTTESGVPKASRGRKA